MNFVTIKCWIIDRVSPVIFALPATVINYLGRFTAY